MLKDWPQSLTEMWPWIWVSLLSIAGGITSYIRKMKTGLIKRFSVMEFIGEIFVAFFVGLVTMLFCQWAEYPMLLTGGIVGLAAHMGSRALFVAEVIFSRKIAKWFNIDGPFEQAQGPQGVQGFQGETGTQGVQGVQGEQGNTGLQGQRGKQGETR